MTRRGLVALAALGLSGCVDGLAPAELGLGRRIGVYPGAIAAVLPPMTDRMGNLYVATGVPDATGTPQPGIARVGGARGGWSEECATGTGPLGGARGWIGAIAGRAWLWTGTAILELDAATGACTTRLDRDPVSASDVVVRAAAPLVRETVSGPFGLAIIETGADPTPSLVTIDLALGTLRDTVAMPGTEVLGAGADRDASTATFLVRDATSMRLVFARPYDGIIATTPITGTVTPLASEIAIGEDGSIAAVIAADAVLVGDRSGLGVVAATGATAIERDDDGQLWLASITTRGPELAAIERGKIGAAFPWTSATEVDAALRAGIIVIDDSGGRRTATQWQAHSALGGPALISPRWAPPYAVGARAWLVAGPPMDRGGIPYSELAVVPIGVSFP